MSVMRTWHMEDEVQHLVTAEVNWQEGNVQ